MHLTVDHRTIRDVDAMARLALENGLSVHESATFESVDPSGERRSASAVLCMSGQGMWVRITAHVQVVTTVIQPGMNTGEA